MEKLFGSSMSLECTSQNSGHIVAGAFDGSIFAWETQHILDNLREKKLAGDMELYSFKLNAYYSMIKPSTKGKGKKGKLSKTPTANKNLLSSPENV